MWSRVPFEWQLTRHMEQSELLTRQLASAKAKLRASQESELLLETALNQEKRDHQMTLAASKAVAAELRDLKSTCQLSWEELVRVFHQRFELPAGRHPAAHDSRLRRALLQEEYQELERAILVAEECKFHGEESYLDAMADIAQEIADLIVVAIGTAVTFGIELDPVFREVHAANMAKVSSTAESSTSARYPWGAAATGWV